MTKELRERFEKAGWKLGSTAEFLGLSEVEVALVDAKLAMADAVKALRKRGHLSQADLAKLIGSSQSRVAKLENHDPEVSMDLQLRAVFAASPDARRDFQGLIEKWTTGARPAAQRESRARK